MLATCCNGIVKNVDKTKIKYTKHSYHREGSILLIHQLMLMCSMHGCSLLRPTECTGGVVLSCIITGNCYTDKLKADHRMKVETR